MGRSIITMNGNTPAVTNKLKIGGGGFGINSGVPSNKEILFRIKGYNLIKYDVNNESETARITGLLRDFFLPFPI